MLSGYLMIVQYDTKFMPRHILKMYNSLLYRVENSHGYYGHCYNVYTSLEMYIYIYILNIFMDYTQSRRLHEVLSSHVIQYIAVYIIVQKEIKVQK